MNDTNAILQKSIPEKKAKRKARRGSGSIYKQDGAQTYTIQYYVNGRRRRESTGTDDYRAAQQKLTQRLAQIDKGEPIMINRKLFVFDLYSGLEAHYRRQRRKSLTDVQGRWNHHLKSFFADMLAVNVTKDHMLAYQDLRIKEGGSHASINREIAALKTAFYLVEDKLPRMPIFPPQLKEDKPREGFIDDVQFAKLVSGVSVSELWLRAFLEVSYTLGWRVSEILSLRVSQIDILHRRIRLGPGTTKSGAAREATMNDRIFQLVKECIAGKTKDDFVLTRENGHPVKDFRRRWEQLCEAAGLPDLIVHDFRRSAAKNLRAAGVAESVIMELCGWDTDEVFRRYAIVSPKDKESAIDQLDAQRAEDDAKRKAENSHSFSHSQPQNSATENSHRKEWTQ